MEELKPCPFCGTHIIAHEHDGIYNWVECQNMECQASSKIVLIIGRVEVAENIGAKLWNTRPIENALRADLETAVKALRCYEAENAVLKEQVKVRDDVINHIRWESGCLNPSDPSAVLLRINAVINYFESEAK